MDNIKLAAASRIIVALLAFVNAVLAHYVMNPIPVSEDVVYQLLSDLALLGALGWIGYKNQDFTVEAVKDTAVTHKLKGKKMTEPEHQAYLEAKEEIAK